LTVLVDTSMLVAYLHAGDRDHARARTVMNGILQGRHGVPLVCDYVLDEALTLLQRRTGRKDHAEALLGFVLGTSSRPAAVRSCHVEPRHVEAAVLVFIKHFERRLSFTDCILLALAAEQACAIASLDAGFAGLNPVLAA
jgi:predicted nucleic acid-binding protein